MAEKIKIKGKFAWAHRLFEPETYNEKTNWSVQCYPDDIDIFFKLQDKGMKNKIRRDDKGIFNVKISRPTTMKWKGSVEALPPPKVTGPDGAAIAKDFRIPNMSEGEAVITVYEHMVPGSTRKASAIRLEELHILKYAEPAGAESISPPSVTTENNNGSGSQEG